MELWALDACYLKWVFPAARCPVWLHGSWSGLGDASTWCICVALWVGHGLPRYAGADHSSCEC